MRANWSEYSSFTPSKRFLESREALYDLMTFSPVRSSSTRESSTPYFLRAFFEGSLSDLEIRVMA